MENNKENKVGCTWSFDDDPFYIAVKITWLRLQKKLVSNQKDKEAIEEEIKRLKSKRNIIK